MRFRVVVPASAIPLVLGLAVFAGVTASCSPAAAQALVMTTKSCTRCHFPLAGEAGMEPASPNAPSPFCTQEEAVTWEQRDKHRQSTYLLLNDRHRPLTNRILGFDIATVLTFQLRERRFRASGATQETVVESVTDVRWKEGADPQRTDTVRRCLSCHAPVAEPSADDPTQLTFELGVSCQVCHGIGTDYFAPHQDASRLWRVLDPVVKQNQFGMVDVRHPRRRAALCASCHVGSMQRDWGKGVLAERRFVPHEWYANGHPPLPGFEYGSYAAQMPAHWRTLREKAAAARPFLYLHAPTAPEATRRQPLEAAFRQQYLTPRGIAPQALHPSYLDAQRPAVAANNVAALADDLPRARDVLISATAVLGQYAELLAESPAEDAHDFALFDCSACHHELRVQFPSQVRRRRAGLPGRPAAALWTLALARLAVTAAAGPTPAAERLHDTEQALTELETALTARPLGDSEATVAAAARLQKLCELRGNELAATPLTEQRVQALLAQLVDPEAEAWHDYHAARQYAWAIRELLKDLAGVPHRNYALPALQAAAPPERQVPAQVLAALGARPDVQVSSGDPRVMQRIDALFGNDPWLGPLRLRLPAGQQDTVVDHLRGYLEAISRYDAEALRTRLVPLHRHYPAHSAE
ncbi:MAG: multiheme c-type cytochrome [Pirellulales bacterium]